LLLSVNPDWDDTPNSAFPAISIFRGEQWRELKPSSFQSLNYLIERRLRFFLSISAFFYIRPIMAVIRISEPRMFFLQSLNCRVYVTLKVIDRIGLNPQLIVDCRQESVEFWFIHGSFPP